MKSSGSLPTPPDTHSDGSESPDSTASDSSDKKRRRKPECKFGKSLRCCSACISDTLCFILKKITGEIWENI